MVACKQYLLEGISIGVFTLGILIFTWASSMLSYAKTSQIQANICIGSLSIHCVGYKLKVNKVKQEG